MYHRLLQFKNCEYLLLFCLLLTTSVQGKSPKIGYKTYWKLPSPATAQSTLESCQQTQVEEAATLRCLVTELGLWTDEAGYNAKRIANVFAEHNQTDELIVVIEYCNQRERQPEAPEIWAYKAYKCATAGRFGSWVQEYIGQKEQV